MSNKPRPKKGYSPKRDHKPDVAPEPSAEDLAAAEDAEHEMYGEDFEHLRDSGWLDR